MNDTDMIFERTEKKFIITYDVMQSLLSYIAPYIHQDNHGVSTIFSLYFDTSDYRLIRESIEKPIYKEKLRMRSYGKPIDTSTVYIEIKKKFKETVYKRRIGMTYLQAKNYLLQHHKPPLECQLTNEMDYFTSLYNGLSPKVLICYDRTAYYSNNDNTTRITFDHRPRAKSENVLPEFGDSGYEILSADEYIMEIKYLNAIPNYLSDALTALCIYPHTFSKYKAVYENKILKEITL